MQEPIRENGHKSAASNLAQGRARGGGGEEPTTLQIKTLSLCIYGVMLSFQEKQVHNVMVHKAEFPVEQISLPLAFADIPVP